MKNRGPSSPQEMQVRIDAFLTAIETAERVRVLYAVESGSRAWGFASTDSDWDVRFIYVRSLDWYLSVRNRRDVLEIPIADGLDASGWDIRKALHLFAKSNPPLLEWLRSPLVYREALTTTGRLRRLSHDFFSPVSCMHHYLRMAERNYRECLPPMEFGKLVDDQLPDEVRPAVDRLLQRKRSGDELDEGPRISEINEFVEQTIGRLRVSSETLANVRRPDPSVLDLVFRECLAEAWDLRNLFSRAAI